MRKKLNGKHVRYWMATSVTTAALAGVLASGQAVQKPTKANGTLSQVVHADSTDPLLDGVDVSNGYIDKGYTYLNPTDTSAERQASYHLTTNQGWSNDLQTIYYDAASHEYHVYFLHSKDGATNPFGPSGQNWNVATTKDFVHFSEQKTAIPAQGTSSDQSWRSAWTGSVVTNNGNIKGVPKGVAVAYFSGLKKSDGSQNIWAAWSDDGGVTFSHPLNDGKPVLDHSWDIASQKADQERDAGVFYYKGKLIMYAAEGDVLGAYQSTDGVKWTRADPNGASKVGGGSAMPGFTGEDTPLECPVMRFMKNGKGETKAVLFIGGKQPQNQQTTGTYYTVGHLDDNGLFAPETDAKRLDQGSDYYGANFSGSDKSDDPSDSIVSMGWVGNWSYTSSGVRTGQQTGSGKSSQRLGSYSLARKLVLNKDNTIVETPITDGLSSKNVKTESGNVSDKSESNGYYQVADLKDQPANSRYELNFSTKGDSYKGAVKISLTQGADSLNFVYDPASGEYRVSGKSSELSSDAANYYEKGLYNGLGYRNNSGLKNPKDFKLTIYTDKNSVELFFPNGQSYTAARFSVSNKQDLTVSSKDPDKNESYSITSSQAGPDLVGYVSKSADTKNDSKKNESGKQNGSSEKKTNNSGKKTNASEKKKGSTAKKTAKTAIKKLKHNAYVYTKSGKTIKLPLLKKNSKVHLHGKTVKIKGKRYYSIGNGKYVKAVNVNKATKKLKHNAYIYTKNGKRANKVLKKNGKVKVYGSIIKIKGKLFYSIGNKQYVKKANF